MNVVGKKIEKNLIDKLLIAFYILVSIIILLFIFNLFFSSNEYMYIYKKSNKIDVGENYKIKLFSNVDDELIIWSSSDESVAVVDSSGIVTAKSAGNTTITATSGNGKQVTCEIIVLNNNKEIENITLNHAKINLSVNGTINLFATITPEDAINKNVSWSSSDESVAVVDSNGIVTAISEGSSIITVATNNDKKAICEVTVISDVIEVENIALNYTTTDLIINGTINLFATITPEDATNKNISWSSSDESVAVVDSSGIVTAKSAGNTTITATSGNGKQATCEITVVNNNKEVENITLNYTTTNLIINGTINLFATITPEDATNKNISWSSSDESVAVVDSSGIVTAKKAGNVTITAITSNGKKASCRVNVGSAVKEVESVVLNYTQTNLTVGGSANLYATILPTDATNKNVTWTTNNPNVAVVNSSGIVTAKNTGTAIITVTTSNGKKATCEIRVSSKTVEVTGISLNKSSASLTVGETVALVSTVSPSNATNKNVTWTSNNPNVAVVNSNGIVTAKNTGTAIITATSGNGKKMTCEIKVSAKTVVVTGISLNKSSASLTVGETVALVSTVSPSNATNKNVTWASNNPNVAVVNSNGVVTAKNVGTTIITVTTSNGKKATCEIKVNSKPVEVTGISLNKNSASLKIGETVTLVSTVSPSNATNKNVTWTSSNKNVAVVNSNGVVTAKSGGTTIITATANNGKKATSIISVKYAPATLNDMKNSFSMIVAKAGGGYYAYAPSIMIKNGITYIWSCQNKNSYQTYDHIYLNTSQNNRTLVLAPGTGWDSYHICDPSVVEGKFVYNNVTYKYAMAYLGISNGSCLGNDIGIAVSNDLASGWVRVGSTAYISYDGNNRWGVGQPSLIYIGGKLILFYTNDTGNGSGMQVRIINPNNMKIESSNNLSTSNTKWMHNADFAYKDNRLYVAYEGNESTTTGDIISDTIQIKSAYIADFTNISSYTKLKWEDENVISSSISGQVRNTNAGLYRTPSGELHSRTVAFTSTSYGSGNGHFTYNIYKSKF